MSMVINLVEDHNIYLCEGGPVYNGGVHPTPITYLTQWKIVGNSEVHTDPYLTSWKVSGNSVVDNNTILSCGDLGLDGYYHVKISNGVNVYDIALTEPLRKVGSVADKIEFANNTAVITRNIATYLLSSTPNWLRWPTSISGKKRYASRNSPLRNAVLPPSNNIAAVGLCSIYNIISVNSAYITNVGISVESNGQIGIYDADYAENETNDAFVEHIQGAELLYQLATPTTETIQVPSISVSPIDTYTSANDTPYSAFEHTENKEIWSCGEYNATDGKYHILVQPQGGSIADIALDAPLRKVNDVADSIEFPSETEGKALVTRCLSSVDLGNFTYDTYATNAFMSTSNLPGAIKPLDDNSKFNGLIADFEVVSANQLYHNYTLSRNSISLKHTIRVFDPNYKEAYPQAMRSRLNGVELIYELATPTTELVDAPQIEEADSYTCVISQGGKAVSWSSFETNSE